MATYNAKTLTMVDQNGDIYIIDPMQGNDVAYMDFNINIQTSDWSSTEPYTYTWSNTHVTSGCVVEVIFKDGIRGGLIGDLKWVKEIGTITFTTTELPVGSIPILVRIIQATPQGIFPVSADLVETEAIIGETNVEGALEDLDTRVTKFTGSNNIEANDDLDNYMENGIYVCGSSSDAATLSHSPVNNNDFALIVMKTVTNSCKQLILSGDSIYVRYCASSSWSHWYSFAGTDTGA